MEGSSALIRHLLVKKGLDVKDKVKEKPLGFNSGAYNM